MAKANAAADARRRRRTVSLLWIVGVSALVTFLIYREQIALLYILATVSVTVLLLIVAMADLDGTRRDGATPAPFDDAAALADGTTATTTAAVAARARRR